MALNFPANPTVGQTYTTNDYTYAWDGVKWSSVKREVTNVFDTVNHMIAHTNLQVGDWCKVLSPLSDFIIQTSSSDHQLVNGLWAREITQASASPVWEDRQVGDGTTTAFDRPGPDGEDPESFQVTVDGILQRPNVGYSVSPGQINFSEAPPVGALVDVVYWKPVTVDTVDGANVTEALVVTEASGLSRTVGERFADVVNVKDFGAVGDGVTDDTAAIQAALDVGGRIHIPRGTYALSESIHLFSDTILEGEGTLRLNNGVNTGGSDHVIRGDDIENVTITGLTVDSNAPNQPGVMYGFAVNGATNITLNNITFINNNYGISVNDGVDITVENCSIPDGTLRGMIFTMTYNNSVSKRIRLINNNIRNILGDGSASADGVGISIYGPTGTSSSDYGWIEDVVISGNLLDNCASYGVSLISCENFSIESNICTSNTLNTNLNAGVVVSEACRDGSISGNNVRDCLDGVILDVVDQARERFAYGRMTVDGNVISNNRRAGIRVNSMPNTVISNNTIANCPSYGVFIAHGAYYTITGNTISGGGSNAIRLAGVSGNTNPDQRFVTISNNMISEHTGVGDQEAAIFMDYYGDVKVLHNQCSGNSSFDLNVRGDSYNVTLLDNRFSANINIVASESIERWEDTFRETAVELHSPQLIGGGISGFRQYDGVSLKTFGRDYTRITCIAEASIPEIESGYDGQKIKLWNIGGFDIIFADSATTSNIGGVSMVVGAYDYIEYTYMVNRWVQTSPVYNIPA